MIQEKEEERSDWPVGDEEEYKASLRRINKRSKFLIKIVKKRKEQE